MKKSDGWVQRVEQKEKVRHVDCGRGGLFVGRSEGGEGVEKATLVQSHRDACGGVRLSLRS